MKQYASGQEKDDARRGDVKNYSLSYGAPRTPMFLSESDVSICATSVTDFSVFCNG